MSKTEFVVQNDNNKITNQSQRETVWNVDKGHGTKNNFWEDQCHDHKSLEDVSEKGGGLWEPLGISVRISETCQTGTSAITMKKLPAGQDWWRNGENQLDRGKKDDPLVVSRKFGHEPIN